ncbi:unnamed protein product [Sphagnum troendelagicum]|uniref:Uncharacterized protein n=1 Tax=Sphagnum troendelagicum TaxID=128251 RepID=A0ABP0TV94_9BRYO
MPSPWHQELGCLQKCLWVMEKLRCNVFTDGKGVTSAVGLPHKAVDQQLPWSSGVHLQSMALYQLFSFAEPCDYLLMMVGMIGALAHGAAIPVFFLFFGRLLHGFGSNANNRHQAAHVVSKMIIHLSLQVGPFLTWCKKPLAITKVDTFFHFAIADLN